MGRRGKQKLPESLELLLDTMCNTFGGIMFIALSLIIISQIVSKNLSETSPEKRDKETIERLERSIAALQQEISDLKLARAEDSFGEFSLSGEQKEYIRKIMENNTRISTLTAANKLLQNRVEISAERLKDKDEKLQNNVSDIAARVQNAREKERELAAAIAGMDTEIDGLKKVLAKTKPKKMHFARETRTYRKPYFVLLKNNNVYRYGAERNPLSGEVRMDFHGRNAVSLVPLRGHPVNDSSQIAKLFDNVDKSTLFVWLSSDTASFDALMKLKDHLRANGYQVFWEINPSYQFSYGEGAEYRAAD